MITCELIVLDFDGTLYDSSGVQAQSWRLEHDFLREHEGMTSEQAHNFLLKNGILTEARSATECFLRHGIDPEDWAEYRTKYFDVSCVDRSTAVSPEVIRGFKNFGKILLLSSNTLEVIKTIMQYIALDSGIFDDIICSNHHGLSGRFSKASAFREIITRHEIEPYRLLSIGDRYHSDIESVIELGGAGILVHAPSSLQLVLDDMTCGTITSTSSAYEYYHPAL